MAVQPIDLQTNMGQMPEIARLEHARTDLIASQQHLQAQKSHEQSTIADSVVEQNKESEKSDVRLEEHGGQGGKRRLYGRKGIVRDKEPEVSAEEIEDERLGRIIDVMK